MTVQDAVRTVTVPRQAGPVEPLVEPTPAPAPAASAPERDRRLGRDRPLLREEREFAIGLIVTCLVLSAIIVIGISLAAWSAT